jgi:hypothetical protein
VEFERSDEIERERFGDCEEKLRKIESWHHSSEKLKTGILTSFDLRENQS